MSLDSAKGRITLDTSDTPVSSIANRLAPGDTFSLGDGRIFIAITSPHDSTPGVWYVSLLEGTLYRFTSSEEPITRRTCVLKVVP